MAGSSLPFAKYEPLVPLPHGKRLDTVVAVGYGGFEVLWLPRAGDRASTSSNAAAGGETGVEERAACSPARQSGGRTRAAPWPREIADAALASVKNPQRQAAGSHSRSLRVRHPTIATASA